MDIIYIEDNLQDITLVKRYMSTTAHNLTAVTHLEDLDLSTLSADLILLDILIDGKMAGLDYIKTLRELGIHCPIVAITALALPQQVAAYKSAGVAAIIGKPFEITELAQIITYYESTLKQGEN